jgi:hypothetical protein
VPSKIIKGHPRGKVETVQIFLAGELSYFILFYFILFYFILFYFILFYFILFYFILFYFILLGIVSLARVSTLGLWHHIFPLS